MNHYYACNLYDYMYCTYRHTVLQEGLFNQIRFDHGKEFYLTLYGQECLAHLRGNPRRDPHRQTESKKVWLIFSINR